MAIEPPHVEEYPKYFDRYIKHIHEDDLLLALRRVHDDTIKFIQSIPEEKFEYRYAEGKWTIKQILNHLIDVERVFAYRALRFARLDRQPLSGFDENDYAAHANADNRSIEDLMREYNAVREATILLFKGFTEDMAGRKGIANNAEVSVRALGYMIAGHELHHMNVIRERYL